MRQVIFLLILAAVFLSLPAPARQDCPHEFEGVRYYKSQKDTECYAFGAIQAEPLADDANEEQVKTYLNELCPPNWHPKAITGLSDVNFFNEKVFAERYKEFPSDKGYVAKKYKHDGRSDLWMVMAYYGNGSSGFFKMSELEKHASHILCAVDVKDVNDFPPNFPTTTTTAPPTTEEPVTTSTASESTPMSVETTSEEQSLFSTAPATQPVTVESSEPLTSEITANNDSWEEPTPPPVPPSTDLPTSTSSQKHEDLGLLGFAIIVLFFIGNALFVLVILNVIHRADKIKKAESTDLFLLGANYRKVSVDSHTPSPNPEMRISGIG